MKVILSRKGFDSDNGGYPSPILPTGEMVSLPIPSDDENNTIRYSEVRTSGSTCYDLMKDLKPEIKYRDEWQTLTKNTTCHLDPDIYRDAITREPHWKPCFGPSGPAQSHLKNQGVNIDDIFLFFGWFRRTRTRNNKLEFYERDFHAIFGYFQIGNIQELNDGFKVPRWMAYHPHAVKYSIIHIARDTLSWDDSLPGAGRFEFNNNLILTKKGMSRSKWSLPDFFKKVNISHHDRDSWKDGYFQSATIGQEFVIEDNENVEKWAKDIIKSGHNCLHQSQTMLRMFMCRG